MAGVPVTSDRAAIDAVIADFTRWCQVQERARHRLNLIGRAGWRIVAAAAAQYASERRSS